MTTPVDEVPVVEATAGRLSAADRCDRCEYGQACVVTAHKASDLMWCAHCYNQYAIKLLPYVVVDERPRPN